MADAWTPRSQAWLSRAPSPHADAPDRPLFIGACPRSGTTLLRSILDNHPDLGIPHETNFVRPLWWRRASWGDLRDPANRRRVAEWIFTEKAVRGYRLRDGRISRKEAIRSVQAAPPTLGSIVQACFDLYRELHGKRRWGDKRPAYSGFVGMLFAMFPNAQYINVVRDPRGSVASQLMMGWDPPEVAVPAAIARWRGATRRTDHFARRLRPDQLLDLRYEDLVSEPNAVLERVCAFAGLRGGDAVERMLGGDRGDWARGPHRRVAQPVTTAWVERWRERLSAEQVALVERATAPLLGRFGYQPAEDLDGAPPPEDIRELARQERASRREWRRSQRDELLRRVTYRRPVAALPPPPTA